MGADPRVGTDIAGHRIAAVIGRGGMSVVYLAEHLRLGRKVALKVLGPELTDDEAFRERFIRESRIAAGLDHPNIVTVYDAGEAEGVLYISMRLVEGTDLERLLRSETRLDPARAVSILSQAALALDTAHAEGLVHRDVKPANILLSVERRTSADHAYLSDFGVTKRLHSGSGLTRTGQFVGTVDYVAPEQIRGEDVDGRADVYSLGCVLYRCLTGEVPFPRQTEVGTIYAHLQDVPAPISVGRPELPPAMDAVVSRALAKSAEERFLTCRELADAAADAAGPTSPLHAVPTIPWVEVERVHAPRRQRSALIWGGVVAGAGVLATAAIVLTSLRASGPQEAATSGPKQEASTSPGTAALPRLMWTWFPDLRNVLGGAQNQDIASVVTVGGTLVAVGHDDAATPRDAAVWTSSNGTRWQRVQSDQFGGPGEERMDAAAIHGGSVVAVGSEVYGGDTDPAVWISNDEGATWLRVDPDTSGLHEPGNALMHDVVETPSGLVAVGHAATGVSLDAAVWRSADGTSWERETGTSFDGPAHEEMLGATAFGQELVAVGYTTEAGDRDAAVWVDSGGKWSRVSDDSLGGAGDQQINAVIAGGPGLVAVGSALGGAAVWTSTDGREWDRVPPQAALGGSETIHALERFGSALVAGGSSETPQGDLNGAIWLSTDGIRWKRQAPNTAAAVLAGPGRQRVNSLVKFGPRHLIAVGSLTRSQDDQGAVWIGTVRR